MSSVIACINLLAYYFDMVIKNFIWYKMVIYYTNLIFHLVWLNAVFLFAELLSFRIIVNISLLQLDKFVGQ